MRKWIGDITFVLVVGAALAGWFYLYPAHDESILGPIETPTDLDSGVLSYASLDGLELAYRHYAPSGEATQVLVLLHDTLLHSGWYANLGRDLAARGIAVYLPDRRGRGRSGGNWREVAQDTSVLVEDITAMIVTAQARYPQARFYLGGHGRGAGLVMQYIAARRPVSGSVLLAPYVEPDQPNLHPEGWQQFAVAHPVEAFLARAGLIDWRVWHYNWPRSMVNADPAIETQSSIRWEREAMPQPDQLEAAFRADVPVIVLQGGSDPLFDPEPRGALIERFASPDRRLEVVPEADYLTLVDRAADPIADWMADY